MYCPHCGTAISWHERPDGDRLPCEGCGRSLQLTIAIEAPEGNAQENAPPRSVGDAADFPQGFDGAPLDMPEETNPIAAQLVGFALVMAVIVAFFSLLFVPRLIDDFTSAPRERAAPEAAEDSEA